MDKQAQTRLVTGVIALAALIASCTVLKGETAATVGGAAGLALVGLLTHAQVKRARRRRALAKIEAAHGGEQ